MVWKIEWAEEAAKEFRKLDKPAQQKIRDYLVKRVGQSDDPKSFGKPLKRNLSGLWRYRVADYRVICHFKENIVTVTVLRVGHRSKIYE